VLIASAGARTQSVAVPGIDMSTRAGVVQYLILHGISPKGIVIQRGAHNYAGPSCPGVRWTCTTAKHVVQINFPTNNPGNTNQFTCTGPGGTVTSPDNNTCTIVQSSAGTDNNATCTEKIGDPTGTQSCSIYQLNTTGANNAVVQQQIAATAAPAGVQDAMQNTEIAQWAGSGSNNAQVNQDLKESQSASVKTGDITQSQDGHQSSNISQHSDTGNNAAKVLQSLTLKESATGGTTITQNQDTSGGPNTSSAIYQNSDEDSLTVPTSTGKNTAYVFQSNDLNASGAKTGTLNQTQGDYSSGLYAQADQRSTGLSTYQLNQNEHQSLGANQYTTLSQSQTGPMWSEPNQANNPGDTFTASQSSDQNAAAGADQVDKEESSCDSTGTCSLTQKASNNSGSLNNSCTGSSCNIGITLTPCIEDCGSPICTSECVFVPFDTPPPPDICSQIESAPPCVIILSEID
jgi:hypothetical protein